MRTSVLPEGTYDMQVVRAEVTRAKYSDKDIIRVTLMTFCHDISVVHNFAILPNHQFAMECFLEDMRAFGVHVGSTMELNKIAHHLMGRTAVIDLRIRYYEGHEFNEVRRIRPLAQMTRRQLNLMDDVA
jgi:hypothetical protein